MSSFTLIHGSGQNAASWSRVARLLRERGHAVATPELPKQPPPGWGLAEYAAHIAEAVTAPGAVVVAHSFSGVFLPLVAQQRECALLVYLAAVIPESGKSVRDQFNEDPSMFSPEWIAAGPRWFDKAQEKALAEEFLFHDCDGKSLAWALATVETFDTRPLITQPSPADARHAAPAAYIVATEDRTISPDWGRRASRRLLHNDAIEIAAGHCPHMSRPDETAAILERLAAQVA